MSDPDWHVETPRLYLSYLTPDNESHLEFCVQLWNTPDLQKANEGAGMPQKADVEYARKRLKADVASQNQDVTGCGTYLVTLKPACAIPTNTPFSNVVRDCVKIGVCTMKSRGHAGGGRVPDVGFAFLKEWHGQGYATEAAKALTTWLKNEKGIEEFFGFCNPKNEHSKKMLRRLGLEERDERFLKGIGRDNFPAAVFALPTMDQDLSKYGI
jgi:hypothetical protein